MVGNTLYYVMTWFESPVEARIYFDTSVPHHRVALDVPPDWFRGLIEALIDVIARAAPALDLGDGGRHQRGDDAPQDALGASVGHRDHQRFGAHVATRQNPSAPRAAIGVGSGSNSNRQPN